MNDKTPNAFEIALTIAERMELLRGLEDHPLADEIHRRKLKQRGTPCRTCKWLGGCGTPERTEEEYNWLCEHPWSIREKTRQPASGEYRTSRPRRRCNEMLEAWATLGLFACQYHEEGVNPLTPKRKAPTRVEFTAADTGE